MNLSERILERLLGKTIQRRLSLAVKALDDARDRALSSNPSYPRDRHGYDREQVLAEALEAWRTNPLARRIVALTTQYVVGGGVSLSCDHPRTHAFLQEWWHHPLNAMPMRLYDWCDELTRSGELFIALTTDAAGMSYVRAIPAAHIQEIVSAENDLEQEMFIYEKPTVSAGLPSMHGRTWRVYDPNRDNRNEDGSFAAVMLHFAVNRPVGAKHGESDLAPLLRWLMRYAAWLEDRARLNRYRQSFLYVVKAKYGNEAERQRRQAEINANPPNPASILVTDDSEEWSVLNPQLSSFEAAEDGLALKKMVATGAAAPLHFLAEPESATRTTAESAGGPTFRHYQQRQVFFLWMIQQLAKAAVARRKMVDRWVNPKASIEVKGADISSRDNAMMATAAATIVAAFTPLRDRGLIDDAELLRLAYRFAGEVVDVQAILRPARPAPSISETPPAPLDITPIHIDPLSGEPENIQRV
jgi:hypothetical protein